MSKQLENQADQIEQILAMNRIPACVTGGTVMPRWVRFQVLPAAGARISAIKALADEMARTLRVKECRIQRRGATVDIEIPRGDDARPVRLLPLQRQLEQLETQRGGWRLPPVTATLGLDEDGAPLLIRLPSPDVGHILISGVPGAGKTTLLHDIVLTLAMTNSPQQAAFLLVDPRGDAFPLFAGLPHLGRPIIQTPDEAIKVLQALVWLMEQRAGVSNPHVIVVIDNLVDLLVSGCDAIRDPLARLLQRGHEAGIHVVAATQKPTADAVLFNNFPVRIVGKINDANEARVASGWNGTGAERLREQGEFIALAEGRLTRFQAAHVTAGEISDTIDGLRGEGFGGPGGPGLLAPSVSPLREGNVVALLRRQPQQPRRSQRALLEELGW